VIHRRKAAKKFALNFFISP